MSKSEIEAGEAYAFLNVVAPRLEQLRRRLVVARARLKGADPERGRIDAIVESQRAIREFLTGIPNLAALVEPIDIVLDAMREDAEGEPPADGEPAPRAAEDAETQTLQIPVPDLSAPLPPPVPPALTPAAKAEKPDQAPSDTWLRIGTVIAVEKLTNAGMPVVNAEAYVGEVYASLGLRQHDGAAISQDTIREWRNKFGAGSGGWRRQGMLKRRVGTAASGMGATSLIEVKARVDEIAVMFRKMAQFAAAAKLRS